MNAFLSALFAQTSSGLFGDGLIATFAVLGGTAGFVSLAITLRRGRAPAGVSVSAPPAPAAVAPTPAASRPVLAVPAAAADESIPAEVMALISAAVALTFGEHARIAAVVPVPPVELLQQWSIEGRRQIYSSHQIR